LTIPSGKLAISVQLDDPGRVAGFVTPGSSVVVFASLDSAASGTTAGSPMTRVLLPNVEVLGVDQTTVRSSSHSDSSGADASSADAQTMMTLGVDQTQADKVIFASKNGTLAFGLLPKGTRVKSDPGVTVSNLFK
jgi:pilus assembly protein CpaB